MSPFRPSKDREEILRRLREGVPAADLAKIYTKPTVYYLKKKLEDGEFGDYDMQGNNTMIEDTEDGPVFSPPQINVPSTTRSAPQSTAHRAVKSSAVADRSGVIKHVIPETQLASLLSGEVSLPVDPLNAVRGILGMKLRPKVLECPAPDLLYPAMIIAEQEWGWQPMQPQDFIDTVLSKFLESADIELNIYGRRSQMEEIMRYAEKGGYKPRDNGNGGYMPCVNNMRTREVREESQNDGDTGSTRPIGEENRPDAQRGGIGKDEIGPDTSGAGGLGGEPTKHSAIEADDSAGGGRSQEASRGTTIEGE
jgi:hypothetical protein